MVGGEKQHNGRKKREGGRKGEGRIREIKKGRKKAREATEEGGRGRRDGARVYERMERQQKERLK